MTDKVEFNDRLDRLIFGGVIIGGNVLGMAVLSFVPIPPENATVFGQIAGGLSACLGIIASATWKTNATERQQAQTLQTLAASAAAPVTTTTTTEVTRSNGNGQAGSSGTSADSGSEYTAGGSVDQGGGAGPDFTNAFGPEADTIPDPVPDTGADDYAPTTRPAGPG